MNPLKSFETHLQPDDYEELINDLLENPDADWRIGRYEDFHLHFNINFYPLLLEAVGRIIETVGQDEEKLAGLERLKQKLQELNNVFPPIGLPVSIADDKNLRRLLEDNSGLMHIKGAWEKWEESIQRIIDISPRALHIPIMQWCIRQLGVNLKRHKARCNNPEPVCEDEKGYERRVQYFERKMEDLELTLPAALPAGIEKPLAKIRWLGTQRQLAELFAVLKAKGWIEKFEYDTIKECFTESNSIQQYLKPGTNKETGEDTYPEIFKTNYNERFYAIKRRQGTD